LAVFSHGLVKQWSESIRSEGEKGKDPVSRILVIDDNRSIRDVLSFLLKERGHDVEVAGNGEEGIALLGIDGGFNLVITDIRMPSPNGNEVAKYIRKSLKPGVCLVAMTGFSDEIEMGLFDYSIEKPFKLEIVDKIIRSLEHKNIREE
jgi:DNA-binding NtrC family response regulator